MAANNDGDKWAHPDDSIFRVVAKPFENGNDQFGASTCIAHCWKHLGVKKACHTVGDLEIHPANGDAIAQTRYPLVLNAQIHYVP